VIGPAGVRDVAGEVGEVVEKLGEIANAGMVVSPWKGTMQSPVSPYPSTTLAYTETTQIPPSPRPYGSTSKELGHT
jgi:hypothetical protein